MGLFSSTERAFALAIRRIVYCNPFLPERIECERQALGSAFQGNSEIWCRTDTYDGIHPNVDALVLRAETLAGKARQKLAAQAGSVESELGLYEDLVFFLLYHRYHLQHLDAILALEQDPRKSFRFRFFQDFNRDLTFYLQIPGCAKLPTIDAAHLFALCYQLRRAFHHIFEYIIGASMPAARLRAAAWQSIFSHDMLRYRRTLYRCMGDFSSLIIGPSGTGKELVARSIAFSRYIPYIPAKETFAENFAAGFFPLNLSALSPTLIESELFGHRRGSFTGALEDRPGWLEQCSEYGSVFLDEIGDVGAPIQVKLLRVMQTRRFQRIGEREERVFRGKLLAATNSDLAEGMRDGRFRKDFYYRLCSDVVRTPSLREQLDDSPEALPGLTRFFASKLLGDDEGLKLAEETLDWIDRKLGPDYAWPGNVREVEQCVRSIALHKSYEPLEHEGADPDLASAMRNGSVTAEQLLTDYCRIVYKRTGSYQETARRLGLDYRTVKARVNGD